MENSPQNIRRYTDIFTVHVSTQSVQRHRFCDQPNNRRLLSSAFDRLQGTPQFPKYPRESANLSFSYCPDSCFPHQQSLSAEKPRTCALKPSVGEHSVVAVATHITAVRISSFFLSLYNPKTQWRHSPFYHLLYV